MVNGLDGGLGHGFSRGPNDDGYEGFEEVLLRLSGGFPIRIPPLKLHDKIQHQLHRTMLVRLIPLHIEVKQLLRHGPRVRPLAQLRCLRLGALLNETAEPYARMSGCGFGLSGLSQEQVDPLGGMAEGGTL